MKATRHLCNRKAARAEARGSWMRSFLLLEVVVGLALLAGVGVWLLALETAAIGQYRAAQERDRMAEQVEQLLWTWSSTHAPVTLPTTGRIDQRLYYRRLVRPVRIAPGVLPTQVTLIVMRDGEDGRPQEVYRVSWLVPEASQEKERR